MFVLWLGERITDKGIGNGISFIILVGIIARLPHALFGEFYSRLEDEGGGLVMFLAEIMFLLFVIAAAIMLVQGTRKIPVIIITAQVWAKKNPRISSHNSRAQFFASKNVR